MFSLIFCSIFLFVTLGFSNGVTFGTEISRPVPMPNFQINKAYGQWFNKYLQFPPYNMACQRVRAWHANKNQFGAYLSRSLPNGEWKNTTLSLSKRSQGVYGTKYDGKENVIVTFVDTDYRNYIVTVLTYFGKVITVSIDSRLPTFQLPQTTLSKIFKKLRDQKIDYSGLKTTKNIC